jgi:hypothetical protein
MPLTVTPTGPLSLPYVLLAQLIAASTNYQTWCGNPGNASAAFNTVVWPYIDLRTTQASVPFALITSSDQLHQSMERGTFAQEGELFLQFFQLPNPSLTYPGDLLLDFLNNLGAILEDMLNAARNPNGSGGFYFGMTKWRQHQAGQLIRAQDYDLKLTSGGEPVNKVYFASFVVDWN